MRKMDRPADRLWGREKNSQGSCLLLCYENIDGAGGVISDRARLLATVAGDGGGGGGGG